MRRFILAAIPFLFACPPPGARTLDPQRYQGLPADPPALLALADRLAAEKPLTLSRSERIYAALELAAEKQAPPAFETLWRQARACFLITETHGEKATRLSFAKRGQTFAEQARRENKDRVEPHYYLALNVAKVAEATGKVKLIKPMVAVAEEAAKIDPKFDDAGALRFLGKVYITAPAWPVSVGSPEKGVEHLERAVSLSGLPLNRLFLGQAYFHDEEPAKAKEHLERALREGKDLAPRWRQEGEEYLERLRQKQGR